MNATKSPSPTSEPAHQRKTHYIDHVLQKCPLIALAVLELIIVSVAEQERHLALQGSLQAIEMAAGRSASDEEFNAALCAMRKRLPEENLRRNH